MARRFHALGIVITGTLLIACSSGVTRKPGDSTSRSAATRVQTARTYPASAVSPRPTPSEASSTIRNTPACRAQQLSMRLGRNGPANGTVGAYLIFRDTTSVPCQLSGWPIVIGIGSSTSPVRAARSGQLIGMPPIRGVPAVRLAGSETATAVLSGADNPGPSGRCATPFTRLQVRAPDGAYIGTISAFIPNLGSGMPNCAGLFVSVFVPSASLAVSR